MNKIKLFIVAAIAALATSTSFASVLFAHQFPAPHTTTAWCSSCNGNYQVFDQFTLSSDSSISQIDARLYMDRTSSLTYFIYDSTRTNQLYSRNFSLSSLTTTHFGGPAYDVAAVFSDLVLASGTYYLSILGNASATTAWFQNSVTVDGKGVQTNGGGGTGKDFAFRITGNEVSAEVPEPTTLALLALGLLGFTVVRRKAGLNKNC